MYASVECALPEERFRAQEAGTFMGQRIIAWSQEALGLRARDRRERGVVE